MITYEMIKDAQEMLVEYWGKDGENVIETCHKFEPLNMECKEFLTHCTACGGNWGGMLLSGLSKLRPEIWDKIPDDMGVMAWGCICSTLILSGVDTSA